MTASFRWGLGVLASLTLQIGCCSIHVDYEGPHCGIKPGYLESGCPETHCQETHCQDVSCASESACTINGLGHVRNSLTALHGYAKHNLTCGSGCGEVYWDEHINEPPVCDPCGCNNEWIGGNVQCKPWYARLRDLWGHPYIGADCSDYGSYGPCNDCGHSSYGGQCSHCGHGIHHARVRNSTISSDASVVEEESEMIISSSGSDTVTAPSYDPNAVPTPAKPKRMPSSIPGDSDSTPNSSSNNEPSGGKTARTKISEIRDTAEGTMKPANRIPTKSASGRRKLTTQSR